MLFPGAVQTILIAHLLPVTHLWFAVLCERCYCFQHHSSLFQCLLYTSIFRPPKILALPTCSLLSYIFLCLRPSLASRNIPVWPGKQEGNWRIAHQAERLGRHLFSALACWYLSPAGSGAGVSKQQNPRSSNYCLNDMVDWTLNKAGFWCQQHQSCHSICSNIPKYLVKQVSFLFSWPLPSLAETKSTEDFKYQRSDHKIKSPSKNSCVILKIPDMSWSKAGLSMKLKLVSLGKPSLIPYSTMVPAAFRIPLWPFLSPSSGISSMSKRSETYSIAKPAKSQAHGTGLDNVWHVPKEELDWKLRENWKTVWGSLLCDSISVISF